MSDQEIKDAKDYNLENHTLRAIAVAFHSLPDGTINKKEVDIKLKEVDLKLKALDKEIEKIRSEK